MDVSAVIAIHPDDGLDEFEAAVESLLEQTLPPSELLVLYDEHVRAKQRWLIDDWEANHPDVVEPIEVPASDGRGAARATGVEAASNDLIAIMDSDDVSVDTRFERQVGFFDRVDGVDAVGGYIQEYDADLRTERGVRKVPTGLREIRRLAKVRCPMNHPTVMFRRDAVLDAGNYRDIEHGEDWDLWLRMLQNGAQLRNVPEVLVKARTGEDWHDSRGPAIALDEIRLQRQFVRDGTVSPIVASVNVGVRLLFRLVPTDFRKTMYERLLRARSSGM
ncbi:glycosyltransferase [Halorussus aquaticus]|uniref:Glycosyltransferase n=1 Tax=Halorussus aquaticus TaxID=2953748 RepID=A0ABD5Q6B2_9EURY|nr:glycosyltransferase [Halorussus aquaticus]